jgi:hypothetical protein
MICMRNLLSWAIFLVVILLAGCNSTEAPQGGGFVGDSNGAVIQWDRSPSNIVFRADLEGGSGDPFLDWWQVPHCTIWGDGYMIRTNELGTNQVQVLEEQLTDQQITRLVEFLLFKQIYSYTARADSQIPSESQPVVETLTLNVNGSNHIVDGFSGWPANFYGEAAAYCAEISTAPGIFAPQAAWVTARVVSYDISAPIVEWSASASGLDLAALAAAGEAQWITGQNVVVLWDYFRSSIPTTQFIQDDMRYEVAVQVPRVTRNAPAAPG